MSMTDLLQESKIVLPPKKKHKRSVIREMAQFSNTLPQPLSLIEKIEEMQKEINYLSEKIDRLEEKIKEQK